MCVYVCTHAIMYRWRSEDIFVQLAFYPLRLYVGSRY